MYYYHYLVPTYPNMMQLTRKNDLSKDGEVILKK